MSSKQLITPLSPEKKPGAGLRKAFAVKQEGIIPAQKKRPDFWSLGKKKQPQDTCLVIISPSLAM